MTTINRREFLDRSQKSGWGLAAGLTILDNAASVWGSAGQREGRHGGGRCSGPRQLAGSGVRLAGRLRNRLRVRRRPQPLCLPRQDHRRGARREDAQVRAGLPQGAGRQIGRRHGHRHARPLARAGGHLELPGGQGRLRGEAAQPQLLGRAQDGRGRAQVQADRAGGHAEPQRRVQSWPPRSTSRRASWGGSTSAASSIRRNGATFPLAPDGDPPAGFDWDMWNGPAPEHRYNATCVNNWHHFWRYSGGDIVNDGSPPDRPGPLALGRRLSQDGLFGRRPVRQPGRRGNARHADRRLRVRRA